MQINELANLTGVKPETIRMYRRKGFLRPLQEANGYYNYTKGDFVSLVYLRKLRDFDFQLDEIGTFYNSDSTKPLLTLMDQKEKSLLHQIDVLKEKISFLLLERRHIAECDEASSLENKVSAFQSVDDKIDFYDVTPPLLNDLTKSVPDFYFNSTPCLLVPKEVLNGPVEDREIPLKAGVGVYRHLLTRPVDFAENTVVVPNGISVGEFVSLQTLDSINILQLAPMMNFAKSLGKPFVSDTTGYLACISMKNGKRVFNFRIRACIEPNDVKDPGVRAYEEDHGR